VVRLLLLLRLTALSCALALLASTAARAEGRFPGGDAVMFHPQDPDFIAVREPFGLLVSRDKGTSWKGICNRAIGFSGGDDPSYVVTAKGTIVAGTVEGASVSRDGGCDWSFVGGKGKHVLVDLAARDSGEIVGVASVDERATLVRSRDDAQTFEAVPPGLDPTLRAQSLAVARSDAERVYVSAVRGEGAAKKAVLLVSTNGGASWTERDVALVAGESAAFVAGVDPTRADRVFVRTSSRPDGPSRLLVTDDAGKSFRMIFASPGPLTAFALLPDATRVYAGGRGSGTQSASAFDLSFAKVSPIEARCIGVSGKTLWACATEKSGFVVGASDNEGMAFAPKLHPDGLAPLACGANTSVTRECAKEWPKIRRELGLPDEGESADAGGGDRGPRGPAMRERGGRTRRGSTASGALFLAVLVGGMLYYVVKRLRR
jgi:photosystem II stability/assembly factor-like uncharacterized protein